MTDPPGLPLPPQAAHEDRLGSWKEIAAYLRRDVTTVQRWERRESMPVHRHQHAKAGSVYAFRNELDAWMRSRAVGPAGPLRPAGEIAAATGEAAVDAAPTRTFARRPAAAGLLVLGSLIAAGVLAWRDHGRTALDADPLADARFVQLTDFDGREQAAAISRDARFVAFVSDRDGPMDVWATQRGTSRFYNLTRGTAAELLNPSIRTLGFSPDSTLVTYWTRAAGARIDVQAVPVLGGAPRPYLAGVAEYDWSGDGRRLVYHTPASGDPMFVREPPADARPVFSAAAGRHAHFPLWSPDGSFVYFVHGSVPDHMDIWRVRADGGAAERVTAHDSRVSHPVFLDERTLLYLATDADGGGPWLHGVDVDRRRPRRVGFGLERYTSLSASGDGRSLVATRASARSTLWRLRLEAGAAATAAHERIRAATGSASAPRLGAGFLLYVAATGAGDGIWIVRGEAAAELWSAPGARVLGGPAVSRDARRIAFCAREGGRPGIYVVDADSTGARLVSRALEWRGSPAWSPDGRSITATAVVDGRPRLFAVPLSGAAPVPLGDEPGAEPAWSPDGELLVYTGEDVGTTFAVKALTSDGRHFPLPSLTLSRGSRRVAFLGMGRALVVLEGELDHKNLWGVDLATGAKRQLTWFEPGLRVRDFDVSADGRDVVLERLEERSDIVLIERPRR